MATSACLPIPADRHTPCVRTIRVVGLDLTGVAMKMQVRLRPETTGTPLIPLESVGPPGSEGIHFVGVEVVDTIPTSTLTLRINKDTMEDLPYLGEVGDVTPLYYDWIFAWGTTAATKRLSGPFLVLPGAVDADGAPAPSGDGFGGQPGGVGPWQSATLTVDNGDVTVMVDGIEDLRRMIADVRDYLQAEVDAAIAAFNTEKAALFAAFQADADAALAAFATDTAAALTAFDTSGDAALAAFAASAGAALTAFDTAGDAALSAFATDTAAALQDFAGKSAAELREFAFERALALAEVHCRVDRELGTIRAEAQAVIDQLVSLAETVNGGYSIYPDGADQTAALRTIFAIGKGSLAPGKYKVSKQAETWIFRTTGCSDVLIRSPGALIELQVDPNDLVNTLATFWLCYLNGPVRWEGLQWSVSVPLQWVGRVSARTAQNVDYQSWPGEPFDVVPRADTWAYLKVDKRYGMAPRFWNRDKDDERTPIATPILTNGDGSRRLAIRQVLATVLSVQSYNPLILNVSYGAGGGPSSGDLLTLSAPGVGLIDGKVVIAKGFMDDDDMEGGPGGLTTLRPLDIVTGRSIDASSISGTWSGAGATLANQPVDTTLVQVGDPILLIAGKRLTKPFIINANADVRGTIDVLNATGLMVNAKGNAAWNVGFRLRNAAQRWAAGAGGGWLKDTASAPIIPSFDVRGTGDNFINVSGTDLAKWLVTATPGTDILKCAWTDPSIADQKPVKPLVGEILFHIAPNGVATDDVTVLSLDPADQTASGGVKLSTALPTGYGIGWKTINRTRSKAAQYLSPFRGDGCVTTATPQTGEGGRAPAVFISNAFNGVRLSRPSSSWKGQGASAVGDLDWGALIVRNSCFKFRSMEAAVLYADRLADTNLSSLVFEDLEEDHFGRCDFRLFGFGAVAYSGRKAIIDSLYYEEGGILRSTATASDPVASNDLYVGPYGDLTIDRMLVPFPIGKWYEHATGFLTVLSGSKLATLGDDGLMGTPKTATSGQATITMPKNVKPEHVDRLLMLKNGVRIPSAKITANGSKVITLASGSELANTDKYIASHEWC